MKNILNFILILCNAINENVSSLNKLAGIMLPPVPKTPEEAIAYDNPDRDIWIEDIVKELQCIKNYDIIEVAPQNGS